jgi:integrase
MAERRVNGPGHATERSCLSMSEQVYEKAVAPGIGVRHLKSCKSHDGESKCTCSPTIRAWVWDKRNGRKAVKSFRGRGALTAAKRWRVQAAHQIADAPYRDSRATLREVAIAFLDGAEAEPPVVLSRGGRRYKPSTLRGYRRDLEQTIIPAFGGRKLADIRRGDLQGLIDRMIGAGQGLKVRNTIVALRALYRHAAERDMVSVNPTANLRLPANSSPRQRAASASEMHDLLAALPDDVRVVFATAAYAGLRRGELRGLLWEHVDLDQGVIHVRRSWDEVAGPVAPKSMKGTRDVPIVGLLLDELLRHRAEQSPRSRFVFSSRRGEVFSPASVSYTALAAWRRANIQREAEGLPALNPIGLHEYADLGVMPTSGGKSLGIGLIGA